jgi:hypothetical protein
VATRGLKIVSTGLRPPKDPEGDLRVSFLELVFEDELNGRRYETVIVATPRGLTFNVTKRSELPDQS